MRDDPRPVPLPEDERAGDPDEPRIYLDRPPGYRRAGIHLLNGAQEALDLQPEELAELYEKFMADPAQGHLLALRDAQFAEPYYLTREALQDGALVAIHSAFVKNPAPKGSGAVVIARDFPRESRRQNRHARR